MTHRLSIGGIKSAPVSSYLPDRRIQRASRLRVWRNQGLRLAILLAILLTFVETGTHSFAQVLYGSLTGTVTDPSDAIIVGAHVTALETQTGVSQTADSDSSGIYRFPSLLPGTYKVTITAQGFSTQETLGVVVHANQIARINGALRTASEAQSVTVTTEAPLLQTDKADVHTDLTTQQIEYLPTAGSQGRNFQSLLRTIPGVGLTAETNSLAGNPQRAINANVNGQSNQTVNTRLDGAQDAYPWLPANVAYVPPADAIETVNVVTNSFDAEQGMAGANQIRYEPVSWHCARISYGPEFCRSQLLQYRSRIVPEEEQK